MCTTRHHRDPSRGSLLNCAPSTETTRYLSTPSLRQTWSASIAPRLELLTTLNRCIPREGLSRRSQELAACQQVEKRTFVHGFSRDRGKKGTMCADGGATSRRDAGSAVRAASYGLDSTQQLVSAPSA
ncbi:hypothetical protein MRX96_030405 [Rhipicephalus microplus]